MALRMEIYRYYVSRLNLWGNSKPDEEGGVYHGHNILLQYGADFGLIALAFFLTVYLWNLIWLFRKFLNSKEERYIGYLFFAWGETIRDENPVHLLTQKRKDAKII